MNVIIYGLATGLIVQRANCEDSSQWEHLEDMGLGFVEGSNSDATHIINNEPVTIIPEPIPPTPEEIKQALVDAVQRHLDATARTRNYDGILSLCSYATSTDPVFAAEGQAGVIWRDACWRYSYQVLADVQAELRTIPTPAELVAELPVILW